jgi:hypothetical protein
VDASSPTIERFPTRIQSHSKGDDSDNDDEIDNNVTYPSHKVWKPNERGLKFKSFKAKEKIARISE